VYIKNTGNNVITSGFITSKKCPWLGYSPDGVVLDTLNNPKKLIEIKCPFKGSLVGLTELLGNVNFLVQGMMNNGNLKINMRTMHKFK